MQLPSVIFQTFGNVSVKSSGHMYTITYSGITMMVYMAVYELSEGWKGCPGFMWPLIVQYRLNVNLHVQILVQCQNTSYWLVIGRKYR